MVRTSSLIALAVYLAGLTGCVSVSADRSAVPEFRADGPLAETSTHNDIPEPDVNEPAENDGPLSRSEAISLALARSTELKSYSWDLRAADARQVQAGLRPNPELGVSLEEFGGKGDRDGFDGLETTVAITQPLELGSKRDRRVRVAAAEKKIVRWDYEAMRLDVIRRTNRAFTAALVAQRRVDLTKNQTDLAEPLWQTVKKRVNAGKDPPSEASKAQIELAKTRAQRTQAVIQMQTQLAQVHQRSQTAIAQVSLLTDQVLTSAESVFAAAQNGYEEGKFDYLRLLDAQRTLFDTQDQLVDAWAKVHSLRADLEYLIGQPLNQFSPSDAGIER